MPSPKKKYPYAIFREDNTYVIYDLSKDEYKRIVQNLMDDKKFVEISFGCISLKDVRAVVEQIVVDEPKPKEEKKTLESGMPEVDAVTLAWLKQQEQMVKEWEQSQLEDDELDGGRFS